MKIIIRFIYTAAAAVAAFFLLSLVCCLIISCTSLPEKYGYWILIISLGIVCFAAGIFAACITEKTGVLTGTAIAVSIVIAVYIIVSIVFCRDIDVSGILQIPYIIPMLSGSAGGIVGANIKK